MYASLCDVLSARSTDCAGLVLLSTSNKATVEAVAKLQTAWVQDPNVPAKEVLTDPKTLRHYVVLTDGECVNLFFLLYSKSSSAKHALEIRS